MKWTCRRGLAAMLVVLSMAGPAGAQEEVATRADLALAYLRFERARVGSERADRSIEREFDRATLSFFSGRRGAAIRRLDASTAALRGAAPPDAAGLRARVEPPVLAVGSGVPCRVRVEAIYERSRPARVHALEIAGPEGTLLELALAGPGEIPLAAPPAGFPVGVHCLLVRGPDGVRVEAGRWVVVPRPLSEVRRSFAARLDRLADQDAFAGAVAACRARSELLVDRPDEERLAAYLVDPVALAASVEREIAALEDGRDPYRGRPGGYWRVFRHRDRDVPLVVHAPDASPGRRLPLLVAFHGAGGEEEMFRQGYGAGRLVEIARERGLLLAMPRTEPFLDDPDAFLALLACLEDDYPVDRARIHVLGHSMGAAAAAGVARRHPERIAAVAYLAGGPSSLREGPRALALVGACDPLNPFARLHAERARRHPGRLEYRLLEDRGHTLLVGDHVPEVVDWLLGR